MRLVRNAGVGLLAGALGTAAMDLVLYQRYRRSGGKSGIWRWEFASDVTSWENASAPGQLGRKALRLSTGHEPPPEWARATTNIMHWATGVGWGGQYGAVASLASLHPWVRRVAFVPVVWLSGYVVLPLAKVYKPIWAYDARTLRDDLSAHIVYGAVVSAVFAVLTKEER
ncbi:hypothetical protein I6N91_15905 [Arthrobacter sp. MSA 4-2]|uniref:hypothetical protein n=1 Tax=Arthrobacter sp. MSA 4-2 TaxID=2794349 RepID=UPI0018E77C95|nr:hypothetical protein [Arthrobacter sp. MSA 4-2]MBJ2122466.1 hypothetical protein [Arthrobacter sp. MSA 4-2]